MDIKTRTQRSVYYMSIWKTNDYKYSSMVYDLVIHGFLGHLMVPSIGSIVGVQLPHFDGFG